MLKPSDRSSEGTSESPTAPTVWEECPESLQRPRPHAPSRPPGRRRGVLWPSPESGAPTSCLGVSGRVTVLQPLASARPSAPFSASAPAFAARRDARGRAVTKGGRPLRGRAPSAHRRTPGALQEQGKGAPPAEGGVGGVAVT